MSECKFVGRDSEEVRQFEIKFFDVKLMQIKKSYHYIFAYFISEPSPKMEVKPWGSLWEGLDWLSRLEEESQLMSLHWQLWLKVKKVYRYCTYKKEQ